MSFSQYFKERFSDIFTYRSRNFFYCVAKTLCVCIGLPLYVALIPVDMLFFLLYACFSPIPFVSAVFFVLAKTLSFVWSIGYYTAVLCDCRTISERQRQRAKDEMDEEKALLDMLEESLTDEDEKATEDIYEKQGDKKDSQLDAEIEQGNCDVDQEK